MTDPWLQRFAVRPEAAVRLFCFSYAGAGASVYRPLALALPSQIELCAVQLPGREGRLREPAIASLRAILAALQPALLPHFDRPFAFFGHSMGALVACELARCLSAQAGPRVAHLFVSGRHPPHLPENDPPIHALPDDEFVAQIGQRYGGIPAEVLRHRDVLALLLPGLRADMQALETHVFEQGPLLDCPVSAFGGGSDLRATPPQLAQWQAQTRSTLRVRSFEGGHFYFNDPKVRAALLDELSDSLLQLAARPALARAIG
ncbi:MAG: alpha/beta fold hydrolase [Burkholderiales bacterium]